MIVKITPNDQGNPPGKLADAELHFTDGVLDGLKLIGFAAEWITLDTTRGRTPARLVLVDATELAWQRAKYRGHQHPLLSADPGLVGLNTLQHWLWQRLQAPANNPAAA